jgi:hypothetical protein
MDEFSISGLPWKSGDVEDSKKLISNHFSGCFVNHLQALADKQARLVAGVFEILLSPTVFP